MFQRCDCLIDSGEGVCLCGTCRSGLVELPRCRRCVCMFVQWRYAVLNGVICSISSPDVYGGLAVTNTVHKLFGRGFDPHLNTA